MRKLQYDTIKEKYIRIVISLLLSCIDIGLVVSLEVWTKSVGRAVVWAFAATGFGVSFQLINGFLQQKERRLKVHSLLWGVLIASAYVLGCLMRRDGTVLDGLEHLPGLMAQIACLTMPAASCIAQLLRLGRRLKHGHAKLTGSALRVWVICSVIIFICWLPVFLAYYPSVFAYDAEGQLYQVIAHDYSTHHPLLHTLFLGAFFRLGGQALGSYSAGMAVHSVVQMLLMAAAFGYTLSYLSRKGVSMYLRVMLFLFYALFPTNSVLAISTTKDVLFSALVLLYTIIVYRIAVEGSITEGEDSRFTKKDWGAYIVISVLLLLFRNNAVYAFVLSVPLVCIGLRRGKNTKKTVIWRKYLVMSVAALILSAAGGMILKTALHAGNGSPREMLGVPLQQMARVRVKAEESLSPEMRQQLDKYLPSEWVFAAYNPYLADPVKNRAVVHDDPVGLVRTWMKLGTVHPRIYIDAWLDNSIGYWFLEDQTHSRIYGIGTESGFGYLSTDNRSMPAGCEIVEHSYLPGLRAFMERIVSDNVYQQVPIIRIIFAPAFYWWLLCLYIAIVIYRRKYILLLPVMFMVIYYLTLLLSPTVLIRYMYPFVVSVPAICCCLSSELNDFDSKNIQ